MRAQIAALWACCGFATLVQAGVDLQARYPATLDFSEEMTGYEWTCSPSDVWRLNEFNLSVGEKLEIRSGPATLVIGQSAGNALWATVYPDEPASIEPPFDPVGRKIVHCWLRFHPAQLARLFPAASVQGAGDAARLRHARRLAAWKLSSSWHMNGLPAVPPRDSLIVDFDTAEGPRGFFNCNLATGEAELAPTFSRRRLPPDTPIDEETALKIFDETWQAFDREYAMFELKKNADWPALREKYRPLAAEARDAYAAAAVVSDMLAALEDLHVYVRCGAELLPGFSRPRMLNANWHATAAAVGEIHDAGADLSVGRTSDGIGYLNIYRLSADTLPDSVDRALEKLADSWALVIDLRFNGGGDETLAQKIAGRFLSEPKVYSYSQVRSGPRHDDLGEKQARLCEPRGPWRYAAPVVTLIGRRTMSSAESFALMLSQAPQVTLIGAPTAGSSGNPRRLTLPASIVVNVPRWLDLDPEGKPLDFVGVQPDVPIDAPGASFSNTSDPVIAAVLQRLREIPEQQRRPAKGD